MLKIVLWFVVCFSFLRLFAHLKTVFLMKNETQKIMKNRAAAKLFLRLIFNKQW